ncbi:hypothetical protein ACED23_26005 [Vibrio splendidus]|uniref:Uncharacterized protein n=1 Tax=Vibrio splendidus TaxID=29497 RepID=A0ABV4M0A3_VIBSP
MIDLRELHRSNLIEAKEKIELILGGEFNCFEEKELSRNLFRLALDPNNDSSKKAHLQALNNQLTEIFQNDYLKTEVVFTEFSKSITLFDQLTGFLSMTGNTYGANFIASQNLYRDAISSYSKHIPNLHQGDLDFAYIPMKLRLAIEFYFKNMIGFICAKKTALTGRNKGTVSDYPLSISEILRFLSHKKYKKYVTLPMRISTVRDINFWSNSLVHTGITSFSWQSLTAIDLLRPLFYTKHENGMIHIEGFNYLNLEFTQEDLNKDLNQFLSNRFSKVEVVTYQRSDKPIEGAYYDTRPQT